MSTSKSLIPSDLWSFIHLDTITSTKIPPPLCSEHRPDLFFEYNSLLVVGEAKGKADFQRNRCIKQYHSFLRVCDEHGKNSHFILGIPWDEYRAAKNFLRQFRNSYSELINIIVVSENGISERL